MTCVFGPDAEEGCPSGEWFCGGALSDSKSSQGDVSSAQTTGFKYPATGRNCAVFPWIKNLLHCQFFAPCEVHRHYKKNECTFFCTDCGDMAGELCQHCLPAHSHHEVIQIRRYVYCDVVRTQDISPYVDVSGVQTYIINQAKVVFLNNRPQSKSCKSPCGESCLTCQRSLRDPFRYCSLACKVASLERRHVHNSQDLCTAEEEHEFGWGCLKRLRRHDGKPVSPEHLLLAAQKSSSDSEEIKLDYYTFRRLTNKRKQEVPRRSPLY